MTSRPATPLKVTATTREVAEKPAVSPGGLMLPPRVRIGRRSVSTESVLSLDEASSPMSTVALVGVDPSEESEEASVVPVAAEEEQPQHQHQHQQQSAQQQHHKSPPRRPLMPTQLTEGGTKTFPEGMLSDDIFSRACVTTPIMPPSIRDALGVHQQR